MNWQTLENESKAAKLLVMTTAYRLRIVYFIEQSFSYDPLSGLTKTIKKPHLRLAIHKINRRFETRLYSRVFLQLNRLAILA